MDPTNTQSPGVYDRLGLLAVVVTAASWGMTGVFVRFLSDFSVPAIVAGRLLCALAVIGPIVLRSQQSCRALVTDFGKLATWTLGGLLFLYYCAAVAAFELAPVSDVALLISTSPLFILLHRLFDRSGARRFHPVEWAGVLIAIIGVFLITFGEAAHGAWPSTRIHGILFALGAAWATASYAASFRRLSASSRAPRTTSVAFTTSFFGGVAALAAAGIYDPRPIALLDDAAILHFLGLGILSTAVPSLAYAMGSQRLQPLVTTSIRLSTPVFATVFALIFLNESPSAWTLPGGIMILAGMYLALNPNIAVRHMP